MRNCYLVGLNDLDGAQSYVQDVQAQYMNDLIKIGVAGMYTFIHNYTVKKIVQGPKKLPTDAIFLN